MSKEDASKIRIIYNINMKEKINEEDLEDEEYDEYEGDKENINIKIFGDTFVENNKKKCKMVIDNKELEITGKYNIENCNNNKLEIELKGINNVVDMSYMFNRCSSLLSLPDISKWNTNNVSDMNWMFSGCSSLSSLPIFQNGILIMLII